LAGLYKRAPSGVPTGKYPSELDLATDWPVHSILLEMSWSTTAANLPPIRHAGTATLPQSYGRIFKEPGQNSFQKIKISLSSQPVGQQIKAHDNF
jgi:hypothetical protein